MTPIDKTAPSQTESIALEFDLPHVPEKVWRALTDPVLLAEWLLPVASVDGFVRLGYACGDLFPNRRYSMT